MAKWNYRVFENIYYDEKHMGIEYEIREVYYNNAGEIINISSGKGAPFGETLEEFRNDLHRMLEATEKEVLNIHTIKFGKRDSE